MITLLRKVFIKNYRDITNPKVRESHGKLAACFGIFSNVILVGIKVVFGLIAKSISMIADSINNLSDAASSAITLVGFKFSGKPADKEHPFGHQRIEYISGLIVSIVIVALSVLLLSESVKKIITPEKANITIVTLIILGVAIVLKIVQALFNFKVAKLINSVTLKATGVDSLTDSIATFLLLVSSLLCYFVDASWTSYLDGSMGVVIAIFIAISGIKMIKETSSPLIGETTKYEEIKDIIKDITNYEGVLGIHDLVAHNYGPTKIFMTVHVEIDSRTPILEAHDKIDNIEMDIKNKYGVELTIHMDPIDISTEETVRLRNKVENALQSINKDLLMHDFRVVHGETHSNLLFDIVVPFDFDLSENEIKDKLSKLINKDESIKLNLVINIDRPFMEE